MPNPHPDYWKIKTAVLALQVTRLQAEAAVRDGEAKLKLMLQMGSLDPDVTYAMDDTEETFTPAEPKQVLQ